MNTHMPAIPAARHPLVPLKNFWLITDLFLTAAIDKKAFLLNLFRAGFP